MLSYNSAWDTEKLTEYLAEEILRKGRLEWLKGAVEEVLAQLSALERELVAVRYFGKRNKIHKAFAISANAVNSADSVQGNIKRKRRTGDVPCSLAELGEREYFRRQGKLLKKLSVLFVEKGITEEIYLREFATLDIFCKIHRFVEEGRDKKRFCRESYTSSVSG